MWLLLLLLLWAFLGHEGQRLVGCLENPTGGLLAPSIIDFRVVGVAFLTEEERVCVASIDCCEQPVIKLFLFSPPPTEFKYRLFSKPGI